MSISMEFRRCIKPLIMFNSIFATGLLEYYNDYATNIIGYSYAAFAIFFYCTLFYLIMYVMNAYMKNRPLMLQVTFHTHSYSHLVFMVYTIVFGILRMKRMKCLLTHMENCTRAMEELGIPRNYKKYHKYLWCLILSAFSVLFIMGIIDFLWSAVNKDTDIEIIFTFVVEHYPFIVVSTGEVSFVYWISSIKFKFAEVNAVLRNMLTTTIDSPQHKRVLRMRNNRKDDSPSRDIYQAYQMNEEIKKIKKIKQIHLELIKCARIVNTTYGWHVLMSMTTSFILLTTLFYNLYNLLFETFFQDKLDFIGFAYWIFYFVLKVVVTTHACSMAMVEIRDFTQQIIQNPLSFTACGFFDLDHTFIRTVIGSVTTYLVILIQVGSAPLKFYIGNGTFSNGHL